MDRLLLHWTGLLWPPPHRDRVSGRTDLGLSSSNHRIRSIIWIKGEETAPPKRWGPAGHEASSAPSRCCCWWARGHGRCAAVGYRGHFVPPQAHGAARSSRLGALGLLDQDPTTRRYHIGPEAYVLGVLASERFGIHALARDGLARLARESGDSAFLSVPRDDFAVCLHREEGPFPIRTHVLQAGDRHPLGIGAGSLALLAALPDAEVEAVLARNAALLAAEFPGCAPDFLLTLVGETRARGYAVNPGLVVPGSWGIGIAVPGPDGRRRAPCPSRPSRAASPKTAGMRSLRSSSARPSACPQPSPGRRPGHRSRRAPWPGRDLEAHHTHDPSEGEIPMVSSPKGGLVPCSKRVMNLSHVLRQAARRFPQAIGFVHGRRKPPGRRWMRGWTPWRRASLHAASARATGC